MTEKNFHQIAHELVNKDVEVITLQGNYNGRLHEVGRDVIILHGRGRTPRSLTLTIRIETIVTIYRTEPMPRGPFDFNQGQFNFEQEQTESN